MWRCAVAPCARRCVVGYCACVLSVARGKMRVDRVGGVHEQYLWYEVPTLCPPPHNKGSYSR